MRIEILVLQLIAGYLYGPIFEYALHKFAHVVKMKFHMDHHVFHHKGHQLSAEMWVLVPVCTGMYFGRWYICVGFMRYWFAHHIIHQAPHLLPELTIHHFHHHKNAKRNYAVSAVWPDKVIEYLVTYI